jgi:short subunit dehydrogenase-like uncharacterized protein
VSGCILIYGANGFTGRLVMERLQQSGHDLVLAGRNGVALAALAEVAGAQARVFDLSDRQRLGFALADVRVVLNAAGPFQHTAAPMIDACIRAGAHYLDFAGEWPVFALAQERSEEAVAAGVMLMPGAGFSIVASDCLLAHAARQVPHAKLLRLAISRPTIISRGTFRSMLSLTSQAVLIRRNGALCRAQAGGLQRHFDYGEGERASVAVSWPDVVSGQHTTGIPNIEAYAEADWLARALYASGAAIAGMAGDESVQGWLDRLGTFWPSAPSLEACRRTGHVLVVEAVDQWRRARSFRMRTINGYVLSALASEAIVGRVLAGDARPGFQTPAGLYGPELVTGLGCAWIDGSP